MMRKRVRVLIVFVSFLGVVFLGALCSGAYGEEADPGAPSFYQSLLRRLADDGFEPAFLSAIWKDSRVTLLPSLMTISLESAEVPEIYQKLLTPECVLQAKRFLRENSRTLKTMERRYRVTKEVVVAILFVESRFGGNIGRHPVVSSLTSLAMMDLEDNLWRNYLLLREIDPEISYEWIGETARRKAAWGYHELKCFLKIVRDEETDPLEVRGSSAGAIGMAQFIPSSYLAYAVSRKGLQNWLLDREEAIFSIGNYLKSHGWKKSLSPSKRRKVLWHYNRSEPYVDTVLGLARKIAK